MHKPSTCLSAGASKLGPPADETARVVVESCRRRGVLLQRRRVTAARPAARLLPPVTPPPSRLMAATLYRRASSDSREPRMSYCLIVRGLAVGSSLCAFVISTLQKAGKLRLVIHVVSPSPGFGRNPRHRCLLETAA